MAPPGYHEQVRSYPPLVLEGDHLGIPTLHPPRKGECCFRWYVTTLVV
jgi:hypothetical protein